jgi:adenylyltransferase/sulfurtransferase
VRDEQVRRYARHILLPDVGGLGQTALMVAAARVHIDGEPSASLVAATYLVAGGVGGLVVDGASAAQLAVLAAHGPETKILQTNVTQADPTSERAAALSHPRDLTVPSTPAWWPATAGDATALAYWRGGLAATRWMADVVNR